MSEAETEEKPIGDKPVHGSDETFLTKGNALTMAAGVLGGGMALVGTVALLPTLAVNGTVIAGAGVGIMGFDWWRRRPDYATHKTATNGTTPSVDTSNNRRPSGPEK